MSSKLRFFIAGATVLASLIVLSLTTMTLRSSVQELQLDSATTATSRSHMSADAVGNRGGGGGGGGGKGSDVQARRPTFSPIQQSDVYLAAHHHSILGQRAGAAESGAVEDHHRATSAVAKDDDDEGTHHDDPNPIVGIKSTGSHNNNIIIKEDAASIDADEEREGRRQEHLTDPVCTPEIYETGHRQQQQQRRGVVEAIDDAGTASTTNRREKKEKRAAATLLLLPQQQQQPSTRDHPPTFSSLVLHMLTFGVTDEWRDVFDLTLFHRSALQQRLNAAISTSTTASSSSSSSASPPQQQPSTSHGAYSGTNRRQPTAATANNATNQEDEVFPCAGLFDQARPWTFGDVKNLVKVRPRCFADAQTAVRTVKLYHSVALGRFAFDADLHTAYRRELARIHKYENELLEYQQQQQQKMSTRRERDDVTNDNTNNNNRSSSNTSDATAMLILVNIVRRHQTAKHKLDKMVRAITRFIAAHYDATAALLQELVDANIFPVQLRPRSQAGLAMHAMRHFGIPMPPVPAALAYLANQSNPILELMRRTNVDFSSSSSSYSSSSSSSFSSGPPPTAAELVEITRLRSLIKKFEAQRDAMYRHDHHHQHHAPRPIAEASAQQSESAGAEAAKDDKKEVEVESGRVLSVPRWARSNCRTRVFSAPEIDAHFAWLFGHVRVSAVMRYDTAVHGLQRPPEGKYWNLFRPFLFCSAAPRTCELPEGCRFVCNSGFLVRQFYNDLNMVVSARRKAIEVRAAAESEKRAQRHSSGSNQEQQGKLLITTTTASWQPHPLPVHEIVGVGSNNEFDWEESLLLMYQRLNPFRLDSSSPSDSMSSSTSSFSSSRLYHGGGQDNKHSNANSSSSSGSANESDHEEEEVEGNEKKKKRRKTAGRKHQRAMPATMTTTIPRSFTSPVFSTFDCTVDAFRPSRKMAALARTRMFRFLPYCVGSAWTINVGQRMGAMVREGTFGRADRDKEKTATVKFFPLSGLYSVLQVADLQRVVRITPFVESSSSLSSAAFSAASSPFSERKNPTLSPAVVGHIVRGAVGEVAKTDLEHPPAFNGAFSREMRAEQTSRANGTDRESERRTSFFSRFRGNWWRVPAVAAAAARPIGHVQQNSSVSSTAAASSSSSSTSSSPGIVLPVLRRSLIRHIDILKVDGESFEFVSLPEWLVKTFARIGDRLMMTSSATKKKNLKEAAAAAAAPARRRANSVNDKINSVDAFAEAVLTDFSSSQASSFSSSFYSSSATDQSQTAADRVEDGDDDARGVPFAPEGEAEKEGPDVAASLLFSEAHALGYRVDQFQYELHRRGWTKNLASAPEGLLATYLLQLQLMAQGFSVFASEKNHFGTCCYEIAMVHGRYFVMSEREH